jgi:hypothetical protein
MGQETIGVAKGAIGRPTSLTAALIAKLVKLLRAGMFISEAATACGISKQSFYSWIKRGGEAPEGDLHREFYDNINVAIAEGEAMHVLNISEAARRDWRASAWFLERRHRDRWAPGPSTVVLNQGKRQKPGRNGGGV